MWQNNCWPHYLDSHGTLYWFYIPLLSKYERMCVCVYVSSTLCMLFWMCMWESMWEYKCVFVCVEKALLLSMLLCLLFWMWMYESKWECKYVCLGVCVCNRDSREKGKWEEKNVSEGTSCSHSLRQPLLNT